MSSNGAPTIATSTLRALELGGIRDPWQVRERDRPDVGRQVEVVVDLERPVPAPLARERAGLARLDRGRPMGGIAAWPSRAGRTGWSKGAAVGDDAVPGRTGRALAHGRSFGRVRGRVRGRRSRPTPPVRNPPSSGAPARHPTTGSGRVRDPSVQDPLVLPAVSVTSATRASATAGTARSAAGRCRSGASRRRSPTSTPTQAPRRIARSQSPRYAIRRCRAKPTSQNTGAAVAATANPSAAGADEAHARVGQRVHREGDPDDDHPRDRRDAEERERRSGGCDPSAASLGRRHLAESDGRSRCELDEVVQLRELVDLEVRRDARIVTPYRRPAPRSAAGSRPGDRGGTRYASLPALAPTTSAAQSSPTWRIACPLPSGRPSAASAARKIAACGLIQPTRCETTIDAQVRQPAVRRRRTGRSSPRAASSKGLRGRSRGR